MSKQIETEAINSQSEQDSIKSENQPVNANERYTIPKDLLGDLFFGLGIIASLVSISVPSKQADQESKLQENLKKAGMITGAGLMLAGLGIKFFSPRPDLKPGDYR